MIDREQIEKWRENRETHTCFDGTESDAPKAVTEWGLGVCKVCGAGESELDDWTCQAYLAGAELR